MVKFYIETYGCTLNRFDSLVMEKILENKGFKKANNLNEADVVIVNTCGVKKPTEEKIIRRLRDLYKRFKNKLIVTGCLVIISEERLKRLFKDVSFVSPRNIVLIDRVVESVLRGNSISILDESSKFNKCIYKINPIGITGIVAISEGCLGKCFFCATKFARGKITSFDKNSILNLIENLIANHNVKEILLTSQDLGCYGIDIGLDIIDLLEDIVKKFRNKKVRIRLGMTNPLFLRKYIKDFLDLLDSEIFYKFIHIPVQSGSEKVLREMNRSHSVEDYVYCYKKFKKRFPEGSVATDIIVGYPTESYNDFLKTVELIEKYTPDFINISKFWSRPNIEAIKIYGDKISSDEKKRRSILLKNVWSKEMLKRNINFCGKVIKDVLINEDSYPLKAGRDENYRIFLVESASYGEFCNVKVYGISYSYLLSKKI